MNLKVKDSHYFSNHHNHRHHTNTNPIPYGTQHLSPTQTPHTFNVTGHSLAIILPTLPHLSPNAAGTLAIWTLWECPTRPTAVTQGSHHHLAILKRSSNIRKSKIENKKIKNHKSKQK